LLRTAYDESQDTGISKVTVASINASTIPANRLSDFIRCLVQVTKNKQKLYGITVIALEWLDKFDIGRESLEYCLTEGRLEAKQRDSLGKQMEYTTSRSAIIWCHKQLVTNIRTDQAYNFFLQKHLNIVFDECFEDMAAYLLYPDRGPCRCNVDIFFQIISKHDAADKAVEPFVIRWIDWIKNGKFEPTPDHTHESAELLYTLFNRALEKNISRCDCIREETYSRIYSLLKCGDKEEIPKGLYHLVAMIAAKYKGVDEVIKNILPRIDSDRFDHEQKELSRLIRRAMDQLSAFMKSPLDQDLEHKFIKTESEISTFDSLNGITGFYG